MARSTISMSEQAALMASLTRPWSLCLLAIFAALIRPSASAADSPLPGLVHSVGHRRRYGTSSTIIICAITVLFFIVFAIVVLHIYSKWCCCRRDRIRQRILAQLRGAGPSASPHSSAKPFALDREIVKALPIFAYRLQEHSHSLGAGADVNKSAECAICLTEFRHGKACKLLPKCRHFFHTRCVDTWFLSNSTCPLCRATAALLTVDEEAGGHPVGEASDEQCQESQRGLGSKQDDHIRPDSGISSQARKWKRSFSDKFLGTAANREHTPLSDLSQTPSCPPLIWERSASCSSLRDVESHVDL